MLESRDLPLLAVFTEVVKNGSFVGAARALRMSKSAVSEQIRTLEERCGARLLERTTRTMRPTQVDADVCASARKALGVIDEVHGIVERDGQTPGGLLTVCSTLDLGARYVAPAVAALCEHFPDVQAELKFDDQEVDWLAQGADLAIRHGVPKSSSFVARHLVSDEEVVVAAPKLAQLWNKARRPSDLNRVPWVAHEHLIGSKPLTFHGPQAQRDSLLLASPRVVVSSIDATRALARAGAGLTVLPKRAVSEDLHADTLLPMLDGWRCRRIGIYALLPSRHFQPRRVTLFLQALTEVIVR